MNRHDRRMGERKIEVQTEALRLARLFFVLPEPVSLPDGFNVVMATGDVGASEFLPDDPQVSLIFHQVDTSFGRMEGAMEAKLRATGQAAGLPRQREERPDFGLTVEWTVVEAMTQWDSPDPIPDVDAEHPAHWTSRTDIFARCLYAARQVVRAYRQATDTPCELPTYARTVSPVLVYSADGVRETAVAADGDVLVVLRPTQNEWDGPILMPLAHGNLADPHRGRAFDKNVGARFRHWFSEEQRSNPLSLWRERWLEARRAHEVLGEEGQAVILANTSCEVLLDTILALLMWEEEETVESAAPVFGEGKMLRRVNQEITPRLGGSWSTERGPVGDWYQHTYRLRHRVVHGGYAPSVSEGSAALNSAVRLHEFVMNRIVERRTTYPRAALMTVAEEGLRRRGLWSGQIKRFAEQVAPTEPSWRNSYAGWYRALVARMAP